MKLARIADLLERLALSHDDVYPARAEPPALGEILAARDDLRRWRVEEIDSLTKELVRAMGARNECGRRLEEAHALLDRSEAERDQAEAEARDARRRISELEAAIVEGRSSLPPLFFGSLYSGHPFGPPRDAPQNGAARPCDHTTSEPCGDHPRGPEAG